MFFFLFLSLFIITLLLYLWSNPLNQLPPASFTRPMASYINIFLTRTVNCLLTKQKSYWQEPHADADMGLSLWLQRKAGCFCEKKKKRKYRKTMTDSNVQPLLHWIPASVSAKIHLLNIIIHESRLKCLGIVEKKGQKRFQSPPYLHSCFFSFLHL